MRVLLACYHTNCLAYHIAANGHTVISVDLKPNLSRVDHHQEDVMLWKSVPFDMVIAFPPCKYLAKCQEFMIQKSDERRALSISSSEFARAFFDFNAPQVVVENPISMLAGYWRQPNQIVRPWWFGDPYHKAICLWLKNTPPLMATVYNGLRKSVANHVNSRMSQVQKSEIKSSWDWYPGMCRAIANQWCPPDARVR